MSRCILLILFLICSITCMCSRNWQNDILGDGYKMYRIVMPNDYSGKVVSTIIKKSANTPTYRAVLYIHGFNDYFFQKEMGNIFVEHDYNFYAIDLRKYGRSILDGQRVFEVRSLNEYFADIDSALTIIKYEGNKEIILMGHSTGGLISSYFLAKMGNKYPEIKALILNSPFMDFNLSNTQEEYLLPIVSMLSSIFPNISISQNSSDAYSKSLLNGYHGEWSYNTDWKIPLSPDVTIGWLGAIYKAQKHLQKGVNINIPILLMRSSKSVYGDSWNVEFNKGDCVLNVNEISTYGKRLGENVKELVVKEGLHDIMLSRKPVRYAVYTYIFNWLDYINL